MRAMPAAIIIVGRRLHGVAVTVIRQLRLAFTGNGLFAQVFAPFTFLAAPVSVIVAQSSPLAGFWHLQSKSCTPALLVCTRGNVGSWSDNLAIDVRGKTVIIATDGQLTHPFGPAHADTLVIDGRALAWLANESGIVRRPYTFAPSDRFGMGLTTSRTPWVGEKWSVSPDGRTLTHTYRRDAVGDSIGPVRIIWIYQRADQ